MNKSKAKNVLDAQKRLILQDWMKKVKRSGFVNMQTVDDIRQRATADLGISISPSHIRKNAILLNIRLPRSHKNNTSTGECLITCTCGRKFKIIEA